LLFADLRARSRDSRFSPMRRGCLMTALAAAGVLPSLASAQEAAVAPGQSVQAAPSSALPAVTVRAEASPDQTPAPYAGGQVARGGRLGVLGNQDFMDVPFSITSYTAQAIQNQQACWPTIRLSAPATALAISPKRSWCAVSSWPATTSPGMACTASRRVS
jgi:iron complex outermembrane receptor protein